MSHTSGKQDSTGCHSDYLKKLASNLNEMRKDNELCDIVINVGGRPFPAHKDVLAASSNYFRGMFLHGFKESSESEIKIDGNPDIFEILLEYAYTGQMTIIPKMAYEILEMGCYMQFTNICHYCSQHIELKKKTSEMPDGIQMMDVFKIYLLAKCHHELKDVVDRSLKYMCENIADVKDTEYFVQTASSAFFDKFLQRKDLSSELEEIEVLEMVINWLKHDWTNRHQHTLSLLQQVRLGHVPEERLRELLDAKILEIPGCQQLLDRVLSLIQKLKESEVTKNDLSLDHPDLFATRSTVTVPISLTTGMCFGERPLPGIDYGVNKDCYTFCYLDLNSKKWLPLRHFPTLNHTSSLAVANNSLYAITSHVDSYIDAGNQLLKYNVEQNQWEEMPSMATPREPNTFPMINMDGHLYVIGGDHWDCSVPMDSVERYDLKNRIWQTLSCLPSGTAFLWHSAIVFEGRILAYGLSRRQVEGDKHIIAVYDTVHDIWQTALTERHPFRFMGRKFDLISTLFSHNGSIYRVIYEQISIDLDFHSRCTYKSRVDRLKLHIKQDAVSVTVEEQIAQDCVPANNIGAFRIKNELFVNMNGVILKIEEISADQEEDIDLTEWTNATVRSFGSLSGNSNVTNFMFDMKKHGVLTS